MCGYVLHLPTPMFCNLGGWVLQPVWLNAAISVAVCCIYLRLCAATFVVECYNIV